MNKRKRKGFPKGIRYTWRSDKYTVKPEHITASEYVDKALLWIEEVMDNESIFPKSIEFCFPLTFKMYLKRIYLLLFRVFSIIIDKDSCLVTDENELRIYELLRNMLYFSWLYEINEFIDLAVILKSIIKTIFDNYNIDFEIILSN